MFKFKIIYIGFFNFLGILFIINNNFIIAMEHHNHDFNYILLSNHLREINDKTYYLANKKQQLFMLSVNTNQNLYPQNLSLLNEKYYRVVRMIKNLEEQRELIYKTINNNQNIITFRNTLNNIPTSILLQQHLEIH
ncbi:conserved hypothetical protein [Candidatus Phytoplasma mali]|uniref:Sequence-variable mosaic (SVM) signal sequence domain-containing protein n=1 Tax=Phytoplasma mali (strain AT) TaxID=482235 RepID=B3R0L1_PHYMT|nr:hypothetical protein [Candidatus Phytoplasma mali]CAP18375.1 conserved hypothetical protein [Candidatus Phytoplasma mali]